MQAVKKILYSIAGVIILIYGVFQMNQISDMENKRSQVLIEDEIRKSSIQQNLSAAAGSNILTWEEVYTTIMNCPLEIEIYVNGVEIPIEERKLSERKQKDLRQYILSGTYTLNYTFGENGNAKAIDFMGVTEQ